MQGKRHVLLALEIPGKPDHFTVLRPSTGPAVKPMKLDELNSRSALCAWLAQLGRGAGAQLLHACLAVLRPVCTRPSWLKHSLACCLLHSGLCAEAGTCLGHAFGTYVHAQSLVLWHGLTAGLSGHGPCRTDNQGGAPNVRPLRWAVHHIAQLSGDAVKAAYGQDSIHVFIVVPLTSEQACC